VDDDLTDDDAVADMFNIPRQQSTINLPGSIPTQILPDQPRPTPAPPDAPYDGSEDSDNEVEDIPLPRSDGDVRQRYLDEATTRQEQAQFDTSNIPSRALPTKVNLRRLRNGTLFEDDETVMMLEIRALHSAADSVGAKVSDFTQNDVRKLKLSNLAKLGDQERANIMSDILRRNQPKSKQKPKPPPPRTQPEEGKHDNPPSSSASTAPPSLKRKREDESTIPQISKDRRKRQTVKPTRTRGPNKRKAKDESNIPNISKGRRKRRKRS
jgi:hypothetical protein